MIPPRYLYVASSEDDTCAYPIGEFLACVAASEAYEKYGKKGLSDISKLPPVGSSLHDGEIGYHLRPGGHFLSRYDWLRFMEFLDKKRIEKKQETI